MRISSWLRGWSSLSERRARSLAMSSEILEPRIVPAVNVTDVVTLTGTDSVTIGSDSNGFVTIDGVAKTTPAANVTSLKVNCSGNFINEINLSGVDSNFSNASFTGVSVSAGGGNIARDFDFVETRAEDDAAALVRRKLARWIGVGELSKQRL